MKQLLFLLLFPCLAMAQYTGNGNQKITLGEQTTADGLVFRGNAADTVAATLKITKTNKSDTSAFLLLDTINNVFLKYNIGTTFWTRLNILPTDTASMLGNYWRSGKFSGVLPVANGGTGASVRTFVDTINTQTVNGAKTFTSAVTGARFNPTLPSATGTGMFAPTSTSLGFSTNDINRMTISASGKIGIPTISSIAPNIPFQVVHTGTGSSAIFETFTSAGNSYGPLITAGTNVNDAALRIYDQTVTIDYMFVRGDGNIGISTTTPTQKLHVNGNALIASVGTASASNAALYITNTGILSTNASDVNKKHNVRNLPYGLSTINNLKPVAFEWNETDETDIGFIAQDIENIIPESVITNWDSELIFRQEKIVPILVKAIQEQQALIKALEQRILTLENK